MSSTTESCIAAAKDALKTFSDVDLDQYVVQVFLKAQTYTDINSQEAIDKAIKEIGNERTQMYFEKLQLKVNNKAKLENRANPLKEKAVTLMELLTKRLKNLALNVDSSQKSARKVLMDRSLNIFTDEENAFIHSGKNDIEIMRALDGKSDISKVAKDLSKKLERYIDDRNAMLVNSGALLLSDIRKDRSFRAIHDPAKLLRGGRNLIQSALATKYSTTEAKGIWKNFIKSLINVEKTFEETDAMELVKLGEEKLTRKERSNLLSGNRELLQLNMSKVDKILDDIFDSIITGKPMLIGTGKKQEMFFQWKDNESWMQYNQKYGKGNLLNALRADITGSGNQIGLTSMFGSDPTATYNELAKIENEVNPQSTTRKYHTKLTFDLLSGIDTAPVNPSIASFFGSLRALTGSAKLGGRLATLSLPDIANGIMFAYRHGYSYFGAYGVYLSGLFNVLKTDERKYIASLFKEMVDTHAGYMSRFITADNAHEAINNFNNAFYKLTLTDAMDRGNKISALQLMARILGDNAEFEHGALNDTAKRMLNKFNITENEWNGVRKHVKKLNGRKLLTIDSVESLTNEELRSIYGVNDDRPLYQLKRELHQKIYSMFDVASENSVLTPGAFMRSGSNLGTRSGTIGGEILRSVMQFKMYPLEFIDRVLYQGMSESDGVKNKLKFAALLFGSTLPMSWLSMYLDNHARGRTMPDWDKMNFSEKTAYSKDLLLPGLGFAGSFLNENNQNPSKVSSFISTPALQLLYEGMIAPLAISEGAIEGGPKGQKKIKNAVKAIAKGIMPGQGLPFVSPYMREMFGDKPFLQPGQRQIFGK